MDQVTEAHVSLPSIATRARVRRLADFEFACERDLVRAIQTAFSHGSKRWTWLLELESPSGIADLVAVKVPATPLTGASLGRIPPRWAYALKCLPDHPFTTLWFATAHGIGEPHSRSVLQLYVDAGFCRLRHQDRTWLKIEEPRPVADRIVAIEAKLGDWRKALYQASRYLDYADESWVVLGGAALSTALLQVDDFRRRGVGLMTLARDGALTIAARAQTSPPRMAGRVWHVNAEIARRLQDSRLEKLPVEAI